MAAELINREGLNRVIVARHGFSAGELSECSRVSKRMGVVMSREIDVAAGDFEVLFNTGYGMHLLDLRPVGFSRRRQAKAIMHERYMIACAFPDSKT